MPIYYRSSDLLITDQVFAIAAPYPMRFRIERLSNAHVVRGEAHPIRFVSRCVAIGAPFAGIAMLPALHGWAYLAAFVLAAAPTVVSGACHRLTPPTQELRAVYGQSDVVLYRTSNATVFGQVQRALLRALECRADRVRNRTDW
jgi:hypothetical protein